MATKLLTQNLADVAAMGATSTAILVSLVAEPATSLDWAVEFARVLGEQASAAGVVVAGGDLSSAPAGVLMVSITALGDLGDREPVLRSGARPGRRAGGQRHRWAARRPDSPCSRVARTRGPSHPAYRGSCLAHHLRPTAPLAAGPDAARRRRHAR